MNVEKQKKVKALSKKFQENEMFLFADYRGFKAFQLQKLRLKLTRHQVDFQVIKNTLAKRAADAAEKPEIKELLEGPLAIAFEKKEGVAAAKILIEARKNNPSLELKGGLARSKVLSLEDVETIAACPPKEVLIGKTVQLLSSPIQRLLRALQSGQVQLILTLKAIQEAKGGKK